LLDINPKRRIAGERLAGLVTSSEFSELAARFSLQRERIVDAQVTVDSQPPRPLSVSFLPLEADSGNQTESSVVIVRDLTEMRRTELERRKAERVTSLANLTAGLAHEIKNPLNSLQIHAQLLQRGLKTSNRKKTDWSRLQHSTDIVVEEIRRLSRVVDNFLRAVRPTRPTIESVNVNRLVERVIATMQPEAESNHVTLARRIDFDIPSVEADPNQLTQALVNLIKNALEAFSQEDLPPGTEPAPVEIPHSARDPRAIELRTELRDKEYVIRVVDNGPGIPDDDLRRIMEPYFTTKFSGTGLGLAIVSRIVEEHGGRMDIASHPGRGTVVSLAFPLRHVPAKLLEDSAPRDHQE
jgi:two-component system, sporulation sensor kinase E